MAFELDPMKHRPYRGVVSPRDRDELPQNKAFLEPVRPSTPIYPAPMFAPISFPILNEAKLQELRDLAAKAENKPMSQYIIWNPASQKPPTAIQPDHTTAIRTAGRMAHENPGQTFYVCKLVNSAVKPIPVEVNYKDLEA